MFRVATVMTFMLVLVMAWSMITHFSDNADQMREMHKTLMPTYQYFDENRNALGIQLMSTPLSTDSCPTTEPNRLALYNWPGAVQGYKSEGNWVRGEGTGTAQVLARTAQKAYNWRNHQVCVSYMNRENFVYKSTAATNCGTNERACSECECYRGTTANPGLEHCPISGIQRALASAAPNGWTALPDGIDFNAGGAGGAAHIYVRRGEETGVSAAKQSYLVNLQVELFGTPCKSSGAHPETVNAQWMVLLDETRVGCGTTFGADTTYSTSVDSMETKTFFTGNSATLSATNLGDTLHTYYAAETAEAHLYARYQIETSCEESCRNFRMTPVATAIFAQMEDCYSDVYVLVWVSACCSAIALIVMAVLVMRKTRATQQQYLIFYMFCLLALVVMLILLFIMLNDFRNSYNVERAKLTAGATCIQDEGWSKLPTEMYNGTDMDREHNWVLALVIIVSVMVLAACIALYMITSKLGELKRQGWVQTDRDMYA